MALPEAVQLQALKRSNENLLAVKGHGVHFLVRLPQTVLLVPVELGKCLDHALSVRKLLGLLQFLSLEHQCLCNFAEVLQGVGSLAPAEKRHRPLLAGIKLDQEVHFTDPAQQVAPSLDSIQCLVGIASGLDPREGLFAAFDPECHDFPLTCPHILPPKLLKLPISIFGSLKVTEPGQSSLSVKIVFLI